MTTSRARHRPLLLGFAGFSFLAMLGATPATAEIGGVWASECHAEPGYYPGAFVIEPDGDGEFRLLDCRGKSCSSRGALAREPSRRFWRTSYRREGDRLVLAGERLERCERIDRPVTRELEDDETIRANLVGRWRGSDVCSGPGCLGGEFYFFGGGGRMRSGPEASSYTIAEGEVRIEAEDSSDAGPTSVLRVVFMGRDHALLESPGRMKRTLFRRSDVQIDEVWLTGHLALQINGRWEPLQADWFDLASPHSFDMADCTFLFFGAGRKFIQVQTQACYRRRGDTAVRLDLDNRKLGYQLRLGDWQVVDNEIEIRGRIVDAYQRRGDPAVGGSFQDVLRMSHETPDTLPGARSLRLETVPAIESLIRQVFERHGEAWPGAEPD